MISDRNAIMILHSGLVHPKAWDGGSRSELRVN